jgi:hypothetical protein
LLSSLPCTSTLVLALTCASVPSGAWVTREYAWSKTSPSAETVLSMSTWMASASTRSAPVIEKASRMTLSAPGPAADGQHTGRLGEHQIEEVALTGDADPSLVVLGDTGHPIAGAHVQDQACPCPA